MATNLQVLRRSSHIIIWLIRQIRANFGDVAKARFEWDPKKDRANQKKHGVSFSEAQLAFLDPHRVIIEDPSHSREEKRYFLFGQVGDGCLTVRFTYRRRKIRIFGAGFWRKGREIYEEKNQIY